MSHQTKDICSGIPAFGNRSAGVASYSSRFAVEMLALALQQKPLRAHPLQRRLDQTTPANRALPRFPHLRLEVEPDVESVYVRSELDDIVEQHRPFGLEPEPADQGTQS